MFQVLIIDANPFPREKIIFQGESSSVFLPGRDGEFEVLDFHKPIITKLKEGTILVDNYHEYPIKGGVVKMEGQSLIALVET